MSSYGNMYAYPPPTGNCYIICASGITPATSATDIFTLTGSSSKAVEIVRIGIAVYSNNTGGSTEAVPYYLLKRSGTYSGGTSTNLVPIPCLSSDSAATCSAKAYSANPTVATLVGCVGTSFICGTFSSNLSFSWIYDPPIDIKPLIISGTSEHLAINKNGASPFTTEKVAVIAYIRER